VTKLYRTAVDALRKTELKALKGVLTKEEYARLKGVLWALRKRRKHLAPEEHALQEVGVSHGNSQRPLNLPIESYPGFN
jgi:hypothetical protein